jgi:hypothetical protein
MITTTTTTDDEKKPPIQENVTTTEIRKPLPRVRLDMPYLGCDPEFFIKVKRSVIGAEKVLPKGGRMLGLNSKIIIDGVQAELNPAPSSCRALLANQMSRMFIAFEKDLKKSGGKACFAQTVKISEKELKSLSAENKKFGCDPSFNAHGDKTASTALKKVDPATYLKRSAGGHIHISFNPMTLERVTPEKVVQMLDIIVGNTCVLMDRDKGNIERRKFYGKAGEYRLPEHGLEYRTLSNFWLSNYNLMSLVFGLVRLSYELIVDGTNGGLYYKAFTEAVDMKDIKKAINTNDFDLALSNFKKIENLIKEVSQCAATGRTDRHHPLTEDNMEDFLFFVEKIRLKGLQAWFPRDTMKHWKHLGDGHATGCGWFLANKVNPKRMKEKPVKAASVVAPKKLAL